MFFYASPFRPGLFKYAAMRKKPFLDPDREIDAALLKYRQVFGSLALFSGVINILMLAPSIYMMQVFDRVLTSRNETTLWMLSLILLGLFLLSGALEWIRGQVMVRMSAGFDDRLGERLFTAAFERNLLEKSANPSQVLNDLSTLRQFITGPGLIAFFDAPWLPVYLLVCFLFHPWLGVFALVGSLLLVLLAFWNEYATRGPLAEANRLTLATSSYINNTLQNAEVIHAMGMLDVLRGRWAGLQQRVLAAQAVASRNSLAISGATRFIRVSWQSLSLALGAYLVLDNQITSGAMIAVSILLGRAMAPVELAIGSWKQLDGAKNSYRRLNELLAAYPAHVAPMPLPPPSGSVQIEHLVVIPPGAKTPAVNGVNLALSPGEVLAVIGPSASGKSSLARALVGIWPAAQGAVRFDAAEIAQWSRAEIGVFLGYLPQDVELFDGTLAENIARFGQIDSAKVVDAARLAGIHEMVLHFPHGYETLLGTGAFKLSGGQKQRIGLARALYGRPSLVVLDEPNSNLDEAGELALVSAIKAMKQAGSTVVLVTHRSNVLAVTDKMLLLTAGRQHLFGAKDVVLKALSAAAAESGAE
jgi:ATP-binding cassette subfamily C exporter for protease/lipase